MPKRVELRWLATLLGASLAFHALTLGQQALFVDEVAELQHARGSWSEVAWRADSMPPLYGMLVKSCVVLFGEGAGVRWLSVAASLATILVVWLLGRRFAQACSLDQPLTGLASAACYAAMPQQIYYAQLIRAYALTTFLVALALLVFSRALRGDCLRDWLALAVVGILGMATHYYFAIPLLLMLGTLVQRRGLKVGRAPWITAAVIVFGCLALVPFLRSDFTYQRELRAPRPLTAAAAAYSGFSFFSGYSLGPTKAELHQLSGGEAVRRAAPWGLAIGLAAGSLLVVGGVRLAKSGWLIPMMLFTLGAIGLVGLLGIASGVTYNPRFVAWCVTPLALWLGVGIATGVERGGAARRLVLTASLGLAVIVATALLQRQTVDRYKSEDLPAAVEWLAKNGLTGAPIFVVSDYLAPQVEFHAELAGVELTRVNALPLPGRIDQEVEEAWLAEEAVTSLTRLAGGEAYYLIECRTFHTDPNGLLRATIAESSELEQVAEFAGVAVRRGRLKP